MNYRRQKRNTETTSLQCTDKTAKTWTRNGENCTDPKCVLEGDTGLTNELDMEGEGKGAINAP